MKEVISQKRFACETEQTLAFATHLGEGLRVTGVNFRHIGSEQSKNVTLKIFIPHPNMKRIVNIPAKNNLIVLTLSFRKSRIRIMNHDGSE
jgi:hypothetical protein